MSRNGISLLLLLLPLCLFSRNARRDSLQRLLRTVKSDTEKVDVYCQLGWDSRMQNDPVSTLLYGDTILVLSQKLNYGKGISRAYNMMGLAKMDQGLYGEALKNFNLAIEVSTRYGYARGLSAAYSNAGIIYRHLGNFAEALKVEFAALKLSEEKKDTNGISDSYVSIGTVHMLQKNYAEALKYYRMALALAQKSGDKGQMSNAYISIGIVKRKQGDYPEALKNYFAALAIDSSSGDRMAVGEDYNNIANIYYSIGDYELAYKTHLMLLNLRRGQGNPAALCTTYSNLGATCVKLKRPEEAAGYLSQCLTLAQQLRSGEMMMLCHATLAELDSLRGDFKMALKDYKLHITYRDSLMNEENTKKTVQSQMQYEFDKKEAGAKAEQEKKDAVAVAESRRQRIILFSVIGCLLLVAAFALFILKNYREKQRTNVEITRQKEIIEEKQKEILDSIYYARRIQRSLLPGEKYIEKALRKPGPP